MSLYPQKAILALGVMDCRLLRTTQQLRVRSIQPQKISLKSGQDESSYLYSTTQNFIYPRKGPALYSEMGRGEQMPPMNSSSGSSHVFLTLNNYTITRETEQTIKK